MQALADSIKIAKKMIKAAQGLILKDELKSRNRVLRRLKYIDDDGVVSVKGKPCSNVFWFGTHSE